MLTIFTQWVTLPWICFPKSWLKFLFHCVVYSDNFVRWWFRLRVLVVISFTVEDKEVSSAKCFGLDCKHFGKLFMQIKNNKGLEIAPCGTSFFLKHEGAKVTLKNPSLTTFNEKSVNMSLPWIFFSCITGVRCSPHPKEVLLP